MYRKMLLRGTLLLVLPLLLSTIMSACEVPPSPPTSVTPTPIDAFSNCLGNNGNIDWSSLTNGWNPLDDIKNFFKDFKGEEHIGAEARLMPVSKSTRSDRQGDCTLPINLQLSQNNPQVGIYQVSDGTIQYDYNESIDNCQDQYTGTLPFPIELLVGKSDNNNQLQPWGTYVGPNYPPSTDYSPLPPNGQDKDQDKIASEIYNHYDFTQYFNNAGFPLALPANYANSTVQVHLTLTLNVKAGWADIEQGGKIEQVMNWIFNYGIQVPNDPLAQSTVTPCG